MQIRHSVSAESVSLYLYLMKGPNDHQLQWPFQGDIVVELINWRQDKGHHSKVIRLSPACTNTICNRVIDGDRSIHNWGYMDFVSHSTLPYNAETATEYLKDDCLHFRVKEVAVFSTPTLLKVPIWQNRQQPPPFQFTVNGFSRRRALDNKYCSRAFFTHHGGYKMRIEVDQGQEISFYARVLKGENDATLNWPLYANIVVELLNWRQDKGHRSFTFSFHERVSSAKSSGRVEVGDSAAIAPIADECIAYDSLGYNRVTNTEFLQDNCLCFRVKKIAIYSSALIGKMPQWQPRNQPASFTITDIAKRNNMNSTYFSPPFYAADYKMCLRVEFKEKEKHISVYACLLKGEKDGTLEWPFRGDIIVEVLNWRGNHGHFKGSLSLDDYSGCHAERVTADVELPGGYGVANFMPISSLYQYLDEQCLRMRVSSAVCYNGPLRLKTPNWHGSSLRGLLNPFASSYPLAVTVNCISNRLANGTKFKSPPFYIHEKGYKLRLEVSAKGTGEYKGSMSIHARLMAGENDDSLKWPMNIDITVEVLNWVRDSSHQLRHIHFGQASLAARRRVPVKDVTADECWGYGNFITHSNLFSKERHVQYVQDDCVHIRVRGGIVH